MSALREWLVRYVKSKLRVPRSFLRCSVSLKVKIGQSDNDACGCSKSRNDIGTSVSCYGFSPRYIFSIISTPIIPFIFVYVIILCIVTMRRVYVFVCFV